MDVGVIDGDVGELIGRCVGCCVDYGLFFWWLSDVVVENYGGVDVRYGYGDVYVWGRKWFDYYYLLKL